MTVKTRGDRGEGRTEADRLPVVSAYYSGDATADDRTEADRLPVVSAYYSALAKGADGTEADADDLPKSLLVDDALEAAAQLQQLAEHLRELEADPKADAERLVWVRDLMTSAVDALRNSKMGGVEAWEGRASQAALGVKTLQHALARVRLVRDRRHLGQGARTRGEHETRAKAELATLFPITANGDPLAPGLRAALVAETWPRTKPQKLLAQQLFGKYVARPALSGAAVQADKTDLGRVMHGQQPARKRSRGLPK